jgi:parvulin-like peptidyl-prolyl isomerase
MFVPLRISALVIALAVALVAAGCGGSTDEETQEVPEDAVAVVGDKEISKAEFDRVLAQAKTTFKARKQEFPSAGSPEYEQLKQSIVRSLVEQKQFELGAEELGISVSEEEIDKRLEELKKQFFDGDEQKYKDELEKQGLTEEQVRRDIRSRLLSEKIFEEVTSDVKVTDADVKAYYEQNQAQFGTPASREVRHILVKTKAKAQQLYNQISAGADFAALAKRNSLDPSSKAQGGKFTAQKGATVPPFDKVAFALKTGEVSEPVKTQFGWHIIEATADARPAKTKPLSAVEDQIRQQLEQQKQSEAMNKWVEDLQKELDGEITYAAGFKPPEGQTTTGQAPAPTDTQ